jgi:hypothetical protein
MTIRSVVDPSIDMAPPWQDQRTFLSGEDRTFLFWFDSMVAHQLDLILSGSPVDRPLNTLARAVDTLSDETPTPQNRMEDIAVYVALLPCPQLSGTRIPHDPGERHRRYNIEQIRPTYLQTPNE